MCKCMGAIVPFLSSINNLELGTWSLALGAWSLEFGAWSLELGACNLQLGAWSLELGAWRLELGSWSLEPATRSMLGTSNYELGQASRSASRKHAGGTKQMGSLVIADAMRGSHSHAPMGKSTKSASMLG